MREEYEALRPTVERMAEVTRASGFPMSPERAYRAWKRFSASEGEGWIEAWGETYEDDDFPVMATLRSQAGPMHVEDIGAHVAHRDQVASLVEALRERGFEMDSFAVAAAWSDHSAVEGSLWVAVTASNLDGAAGILQAFATPAGSPAP